MAIINNSQYMDRTAAIEKVPFKPNLIGALGLFREQPVGSDAITFDVRENSLFVLEDHLRNTDGKNALNPDEYDIHTMAIPHYPVETTISRNRLAGVRGFGKDTEQAIEAEVAKELVKHGEIHDEHYEYLRAMMVCQGVIATTYYGNISAATEFGVVRPTKAIDFADTVRLEAQIRAAQQTGKKGLTNGGRVQGWVILAGSEWFDKFVGHADVREGFAFKGESPLRNELGTVANGYSVFRYGNVDVIMYDDQFSKKDGTVVTPLDPAKAVLLPRAVLGSAFFGPVSKLSGVGSMGAKRFASSYRDPKDRYVEMESEQNTLVILEQLAATVELTIKA